MIVFACLAFGQKSIRLPHVIGCQFRFDLRTYVIEKIDFKIVANRGKKPHFDRLSRDTSVCIPKSFYQSEARMRPWNNLHEHGGAVGCPMRICFAVDLAVSDQTATPLNKPVQVFQHLLFDLWGKRHR